MPLRGERDGGAQKPTTRNEWGRSAATDRQFGRHWEGPIEVATAVAEREAVRSSNTRKRYQNAIARPHRDRRHERPLSPSLLAGIFPRGLGGCSPYISTGTIAASLPIGGTMQSGIRSSPLLVLHLAVELGGSETGPERTPGDRASAAGASSGDYWANAAPVHGPEVSMLKIKPGTRRLRPQHRN